MNQCLIIHEAERCPNKSSKAMLKVSWYCKAVHTDWQRSCTSALNFLLACKIHVLETYNILHSKQSFRLSCVFFGAVSNHPRTLPFLSLLTQRKNMECYHRIYSISHWFTCISLMATVAGVLKDWSALTSPFSGLVRNTNFSPSHTWTNVLGQ